MLGNHDWHAGRSRGNPARSSRRPASSARPRATVCEAGEVEVGIVGVKGFVGGFAPRHLPDFGEPSLRAVYPRRAKKWQALEEGLRGDGDLPGADRPPPLRTDRGDAGRGAGEIWVFLGWTAWPSRSSSTAPTSSSTATPTPARPTARSARRRSQRRATCSAPTSASPLLILVACGRLLRTRHERSSVSRLSSSRSRRPVPAESAPRPGDGSARACGLRGTARARQG